MRLLQRQRATQSAWHRPSPIKSRFTGSRLRWAAFISFVLLSAFCHVVVLRSGASDHPSRTWQKRSSIIEAAPPSEPAEPSCVPVPNDLPPKTACKYIQKHCTEDDDKALAKYLTFYYCADAEYHDDDSEFPHHTRAIRSIRLVALLAWLTLLFSSVGIVASDFFCPNLSTLANRFGMSDSTAGVTLLSFGNSSPDVFSTYGAMRSGSGALAIGELIGAASFIVSIVAGSVMLIADFHVQPYPFCRDVGFFAIAVAVVLAFLVDGELHLGESLILVGLYVVYASIVIAGDWWQRRKGPPRIELPGEEASLYGSGEHRPASSEDLSQAPHLRPSNDPEANDASLLIIAHSSGFPSPSDGSSPLHHKFRPGYLPRHSILGAIEFRDVLQNLRKEAGSDHSVELFQSRDPDLFLPAHHPHALSRGHSLSSRPNLRLKTSRVASSGPMTHSGVVSDGSQDTRRRSLSLSGTDDYFSQQHEADAASLDLDRNVWQDDAAGSKGSRQRAIPVHEQHTERVLSARIPESPYVKARRNFLGFLRAVFPSLQNLWAKSWLGIFISFATAPTILCLNLTLPIVDDELEAKIVQIESKANASASLSLPGPENVLLAHGGQEPLHDAAVNSQQAETVEDEESIEALIELAKARKILMPLQCLIATPFCVWALSDNGDPHLLFKVLIALACGAILAAVSAFVLWRARKRRPSPWVASLGVLARCVIGFLVAVLWIMTIVDQVILVLQALGSISGVSDAVLGLTVFAAGNSLGDFVANTTMAPLHPVMAISACFAGPLLNLLLGIGLSGTVLLSAPGRDTYAFDFSPTLLISGGGILLLLLGLLIAVPLQGFHLTRKTGICLASGYAAIMTINLIAVWAGFDTPM